MTHRNRYFFIGKVDLGPKIKIVDSISGRPIRRVYVVKDYGPGCSYKKPKILSISQNTAIGLLATEMNSIGSSKRVQNVWKTIKSGLKWLNPEHVALTVKSIEKYGSTHLLVSFLEQLCKGYPLSEKQLAVLENYDKHMNHK